MEGTSQKACAFLVVMERGTVLRTIDKTLDLLVPDQLKGSFVNDVVNDQISTAHPYGPIAIAEMAGSISLLHANPKIYYVPDDPGLGEFRTIFANKLCLLEERPSGKGWEHSDPFGNADDIVNTEKMLNEVFASTKNLVDQQTFLRVRLFDMLVNDWDRHEDQWVWAMKKMDKQRSYIPIARDRDQAFSKTDGIALYFLSRRWAFRPLESMDPTVKDVRGANFSARNLDQQFLNKLTKEDWKQSIHFIQENLTNSAIENAIQTMPAEVNKISGEYLTNRLIERRDNLSSYGIRYYSIMSKRVTINGSSENELFVVNLVDKNQVSVTGFRPGNDTFFHRTFYRQDTKEINIYGLDGDDQYLLKGSAKNRFIIRFLGGEGNNQYNAEEPKTHGKAARIYDSLHLNGFSRKTFRINRHWDSLYRYNRTSVKYDWSIPLIVPGYNPDDGFTIGLGLLYKNQIWGKTPFGWQQRLTVDYATGTSAVGFGYRGVFKQTLGKWDGDLDGFYKGPRYTFNYYGLGNETELNNQSRSFFRVKGNNFYLSPGISRTWNYSYFRFGLQYESVDILRAQNKFVTSPHSHIAPGTFSLKHFAGVNGEWNFFNAGNERYPTKGFRLSGAFSYLNNLRNTNSNLLRINGSATIYHTFFKRLTFSHRTGAATLFGDYEFYQANTLGSDQNLRGFWRARFAGRSSFYQNTELRYNVANLRGYYVRGKLGLFGFVDNGRVWIKNERSSEFHIGYGGGVFVMPYNLLALNIYYAKSNEASMVTVKAGFFF